MMMANRNFKHSVVAVGNTLRVLLFLILLLVSSIHIVVQVLTPSLTLAFLRPRWVSASLSHVVNLWHWFTVTLCEHLLGVKVVVTGNPPTNRKPVLMIMNHRTRLDWLFFFGCHARYARLGNLRVCLKEVLKHMPGAGWGIQLLVFLFVKRRWEHDELVFNRCIRYYYETGLRPHILLFPEGTDLTPSSREKSDKFAVNNNLPLYTNLLNPRTKGFTYIAEKLKQYFNSFDVVDVTVAYPYNACQGESDLVLGNIPKEIHFHVETIPPGSVPTSREELETWCHDRWNKKEVLLSQFHRQKHFPNGTNGSFISNKVFVSRKLFAGLFWICHTIVSTAILINSPIVQVYYVVGLCLYLLSIISVSGLDVLVPNLQTYNSRFISQKRPTD